MDPLNCRPAVFESSTGDHIYRLAWKARRAELEILADRGQAKSDAARRVPVLRDTSICKQWYPNDSERRQGALLRATLWQKLFVCLEVSTSGVGRIFAGLCAFIGIAPGAHPHQLDLAEFASLMARDVAVHADLIAKARHSRRRQTLGGAPEPATAEETADAQPSTNLATTDIGGGGDAPHEGEDDIIDEHTVVEVHYEQWYDLDQVARCIRRSDELAALLRPGRHKDAHKEMSNFMGVFGAALQDFKSLPACAAARRGEEPAKNLAFGSAAEAVRLHQIHEVQARRSEQGSARSP